MVIGIEYFRNAHQANSGMIVFQRAVVIALVALGVEVKPILVHHFIDRDVLRITDVDHPGSAVALIQLDDKGISLLFHRDHNADNAHQH